MPPIPHLSHFKVFSRRHRSGSPSLQADPRLKFLEDKVDALTKDMSITLSNQTIISARLDFLGKLFNSSFDTLHQAILTSSGTSNAVNLTEEEEREEEIRTWEREANRAGERYREASRTGKTM